MVKSKNIIAGLGVVAGLGMALLPLGAFATDGQIGGVESNAVEHTVRGVVGDVISISLTTNKGSNITIGQDTTKEISLVNLTPGKLNTSLIHTVTVKTNAKGGYDLKLSAKDGKNALRYITGYDDTYEDVAASYSEEIVIPAASTSGVALDDKAENDETAGAWGYRIADGTVAEADFSGNFKGVPASGAATIKTKAAPATTGTGAVTGAYTDTYSVNFGIVPANNQMAGAYEATIVYQAVTNAI